jgi:hypothetical protein
MRRIGLGACVVLALLPFASDRAQAQSIGVFGDSLATTCNITWNTAQRPIAYVYLAVLPGPLPGFTSAELRVTGLPSGPIPPQTEFFNNPAVTIGNSIADGQIVAYNSCQGEGASGPVPLGKITLVSINPVGEHLLTVEASLTPSNPNFVCPALTLCNDPSYTKVCVAGGQAFLNSSRDCTVAVEERSWSQVKQLYKH